MNRLFTRLAPVALALVMIIMLGSCSKSGDMEALLKTVPADAALVASFNADEVLDQLDYKQEGDHASYCKELGQIIEAAGMDRKVLNMVTDGIDLTDKVMVAFAKGNTFCVTFSVKDADNFKKWYAGVSDEELEDEGDGFFSGNAGRIMLKDNQVWASSEKIQVSALEEMLSLSGDDSFAGKYSAMAGKMCDKSNYGCAFLNIDESISLIRKSGGASEAAQMQLALGMLFKDADYLSLVATLASDKVTGELTVLNAKGEPAEFLIPMGKINTGAMNKVNSDAAFVAAIDFSPELMSKLQALKTQYAANLSGTDALVADMLLNLSGTTAFSFNGPLDYIVSVGMKNADAATGLGKFLSSSGTMPVKVSAADKFLIIRSAENVKSGGNAPKSFSGNFFGLYMDFENPAIKQLVPMNMSGMGNMTLTLGPDGKGVMLRSEWVVKDPVKTSLKLYSDWYTQMSAPAVVTATQLDAYSRSAEEFELEPDSDIYY